MRNIHKECGTQQSLARKLTKTRMTGMNGPEGRTKGGLWFVARGSMLAWQGKMLLRLTVHQEAECFYVLSLIAVLNVQVSDTTSDDSSNTAGYIINHHDRNRFHEKGLPTVRQHRTLNYKPSKQLSKNSASLLLPLAIHEAQQRVYLSLQNCTSGNHPCRNRCKTLCAESSSTRL